MFVLLQVYPPEAMNDENSDICCCLDVNAEVPGLPQSDRGDEIRDPGNPKPAAGRSRRGQRESWPRPQPSEPGARRIPGVGRVRLERGATVYRVEVDGTTFDLIERFGGVKLEVQ